MQRFSFVTIWVLSQSLLASCFQWFPSIWHLPGNDEDFEKDVHRFIFGKCIEECFIVLHKISFLLSERKGFLKIVEEKRSMRPETRREQDMQRNKEVHLIVICWIGPQLGIYTPSSLQAPIVVSMQLVDYLCNINYILHVQRPGWPYNLDVEGGEMKSCWYI